MNAGVTVPPGFAVTTEFYDHYLEQTGLDEEITTLLAETNLSDEEAVQTVSADVRSQIGKQTFPTELDEAIETGWERLKSQMSEPADLSVAVRSSATAEDLPDASFAGQQDTYLGAESVSVVKDRIRDCIASLFTARAVRYREENGFNRHDVKISVGVQKMVDARSSGVMFTLNPANGDRSKVRIESNWGLGEAVVSGSMTPDSFLVDKPVYDIVERNISDKHMKIVPTEDGVEEVEMNDNERTEPSLSHEEVKELTDLAKRIESHYGTPQDIEWAIEESGGEPQIFVLQSRPETTWNEATADAAAETVALASDEAVGSSLSSSSTAEAILDNFSGGD